MNWDWEKLRENKEKYEKKQGGGGMPKPPQPPQFDDIVKKFKGFKFGGILIVLVVLFLLFFGKSMVFQIELDEVGVIQQFGKFDRITDPGLHFKFPAGIEKVTKVQVKRVRKEEFGFKTIQGSNDSRYFDDSAGQDVAMMLAGDLNVAIVPWIVQYRVSNPEKFLFEVRDVTTLLRDMSEATMRTIIGDRSINEVISEREEIAIAARESLQKEMDQASAGIKIVTIEMKKTNVPEPVQDSFNEVNEAIQEKEQTIYKAKEEYNKAIPRAEGEAKRVVEAAHGYAINRVNRAQGDVAKFSAVYKEYAKAKNVTKKRLYLEAMTEVVPKLGKKYIMDSSQKNLLPLLNLGGERVLPTKIQSTLK
ncbi:MAG: FtsH protease activity modulator HflK [Desulfobacteraceae bacterium]|nr:FtsH protease activity modulator HflK [Desulfobacteraceae bacterium]